MKFAVIVILLVLLLGCSSTPTEKPWPKNIPKKSYFVSYYEQDPKFQKITSEETYLLWIGRFYSGWELYGRGWLQATDELMATLHTPEERQKAQEFMWLIGKKCSAEWAKDRSLRVINTRHLMIWGTTLNLAAAKKEQMSMLPKILNDVDSLLQRKIKPKTITYSRYYETKPFLDSAEAHNDF